MNGWLKLNVIVFCTKFSVGECEKKKCYPMKYNTGLPCRLRRVHVCSSFHCTQTATSLTTTISRRAKLPTTLWNPSPVVIPIWTGGSAKESSSTSITPWNLMWCCLMFCTVKLPLNNRPAVRETELPRSPWKWGRFHRKWLLKRRPPFCRSKLELTRVLVNFTVVSVGVGG